MKLMKTLFVVIALLVVGNVTLTNLSLDQSLAMTNLTKDIQALEKNNAILKSEIAIKGSLATIEPRVEAAGFISPTSVIAIGAAQPTVALR